MFQIFPPSEKIKYRADFAGRVKKDATLITYSTVESAKPYRLKLKEFTRETVVKTFYIQFSTMKLSEL